MNRKALFKRLFLIYALTAITGTTLFAQQTGSFNETITFMSASRTLSCYVPPAYDPNVPTKLMIGLHGLGDNSNSYRNALVNSLGFASAVPNTILICPDGGSDPLKDFYSPAGDEAIIEECITFAKTNYNIDTTEIILQGFSLGGRSALRYGLQHTETFKGLLLNTPAVQGVKEAVKQFAAGGLYDYAQASQIPIFITHGNTDELYLSPIDSTYEQLIRNNAAVHLFRFNGGHTVPPFAQQGFPGFFDEPVAPGAAVRSNKLTVSPRTCDPNITARVLVQNAGTITIDSMRIKYEWNGTPQYFTWTGSLLSLQHAEIDLPVFAATAGNHTLTVTVESVNGSTMTVAESKADFRVVTAPANLPVTEEFNDDSYDETWLTQISGDLITPWSYDDEVKALACLNTIFIFENSNQKEEFLSPVLNLFSMPDPKLTFDVAFNYTTFTAAFFGVDTAFSDTLEVLVSTDCGETYQSVYKKAGADLATFADPIENPNGIAAYFVVPEEGDWRKETIDLAAYASSQDAVVKFRYISGLGGIIYLDNIAFGDGQTSINELSLSDLKIYPNPVQDKVMIDSENETLVSVSVFDISGRKMMTQESKGAKSVQLSTNTLPNGIYLLDIQSEKGHAKKKITVRH